MYSKRRFLEFLPTLLLVACTPAERNPSAPIKRYEMLGEVLEVERDRKIVTIKHERIGDWMEAMTMQFPVRDASDLTKLQAGKRIRATVFVQNMDYWVGEVEVQ